MAVMYPKPYIVGQLAEDPLELEYSDIVDRSDFRFKDDNAKISRLSEEDTGSFQGEYDYDGNLPVDDDHDPVNMLVVNLRQGKYSKGEIEDIKRVIDNAVQDEIVSNASAKTSKQKKALQDKIDSAIAQSLEKSEKDVDNG